MPSLYYRGLDPSRVRIRIPSTHRICQRRVSLLNILRSFRVCNRQQFGAQKAKTGDRGTNVYSCCCCCCCCCCLHIKSRSDLYSVLSNIRTGPTDANAFRGHKLTTQKGYTYRKEIKRPRKVNTHAIIGKENNPPQKNKAPDSQASQATRQRR